MKKNRKFYSTDWEFVSRQRKELAGWKCQKCGMQFEENCNVKFVNDGGHRKVMTLTVHHKDRNTLNNKPENLIVLCSACHCRAELPLIRQEKRAEAHKNQGELF